MRVPLLDLKPQYDSLKPEIDRAIQRVVSSQQFVMGPEVEGLEAEIANYVGTPHAVGCASGTDALLLPLMALEPEPGDEVILPAFTFFATAGAVWNAGFTPVFCDIDPLTFNVNAASVAAVWSDRTRVVIPVHLFGQMAPMEEICALAAERGAVVIEDAAQAIGASRRRPDRGGEGARAMAGAWGEVGALSFFPTKNLGGFGDGGMVVARDGALAEKVAKLRVHGGRQMYHHEMVGTNSRLDALQAAVLRVKLGALERWTEARRANAALYLDGLADVPGITLPTTLEGNRHVYNQFTIRAERRDALREHLGRKGIGSGVYYPVPLHLQECFGALGGEVGDLPECEAACREVLSLPVFAELGAERVEIVIDAVREFQYA
jgi:dTDP-4-amino-4,6-dideoxygalactose transaminase